MNRLQEIEARLAAIANEIEQRGAELTAEQLTAFETEVNNLVHREQASIRKQSNEAEHFNTAFRSRVAEPKRRYGHLEHGACGGRRKILYPQGIHRNFTAWKGGEHKCR